MQDICCKLSRTAAVLVMLLAACVGSAWGATGYAGGVPWQVGDIIVCFGSGTCNVLRIVGGNPILLDQFVDSSTGHNLSGNTYGVAINNTLHVVATDDTASPNGTGSNLVVFSIGSLNPNTSPATPVPHTPVFTYDSSKSGTSTNPKAIAINNAGNMFVLNASVPNIVELGPGPSQSVIGPPIPLTGCPAVTSMDLSSDGKTAYITAASGTIWTAPIPGGGCTKFADFGSRVTLYGIKDIPANALSGTCGSNPFNPPSNPCPIGESLLVVAKGFTDPDADTNETGEPQPPLTDPDAVNICTNQMDQTPVSCAILLDKAGAGLNAQPWVSSTQYFNTNTTILDPHGHVQQVLTAGTSGADEPNFGQSATTIDNAVKWTDLGLLSWTGNHPYAVGALPGPSVAAVAGTYFVDPNGNLETITAVTGGGLSGNVEPGYVGHPAVGNPVSWSTADGGTTFDGLQWQDQGGWQPTHIFSGNDVVADLTGDLHGIKTPGTSGTNQPTWADPGTTADNPVTWTDQGNWQPNTPYSGTQVVGDASSHLHSVKTPGTSGAGASTPAGGWHDDGTVTNDNEVMWVNLGTPNPWTQGATYTTGTIVTDNNGNVEQMTGGTSPCQSDQTEGDTTPGNLPWNTAPGSVTPDNACSWTNLGSETQSWSAGIPYGFITNTQVGQIVAESCAPAVCIQQVTTAGTSGPTNPSNNPVQQPYSGWTQTVGGPTTDGLTWTDLNNNNHTYAWVPNHGYLQATSSTDPNGVVVDPSGHVQEVVNAADAGTSGPYQPGTPANVTSPPPNPWTDSAPPTFGGKTIDGLQWTDQGPHVWIGGHLYSTLGEPISDQKGLIAHVQKVYEAGTARSGNTPPVFNQSGGLTIDQAVTWTKEHPKRVASQAYVLNSIVLDTFSPLPHVQQVTSAYTYGAVQTGGTTGPADPFIGFKDDATTSNPDGLQWTDQPNPPVLARYPVTNNTTIQSLALDPIITDCTGSNCSSTVPSPTTSNFWLGDKQYSSVFKVDFATGNPIQYPANGNNCTSPCVPQGPVQGIAIYGGEGSNQPGLTKVLSSVANGTGNNQTASFPLPTDPNNTNSLTLSLYNGTTLAGSLPDFAVYGSSVPLGSCFFDGTPSLPCTKTTATGNAIVWKNDIPLPSSGSLRLDPSTQTLAYSFDVPLAFQSVNNNVFVDSSYNTTTGVGNDYPSGRYPSSTGIGTPVNANGKQPVDFGCSYTTPVPHQCFQNPITIPVKFTCNKLPRGFKLQNFGISSTTPWGPRLQIVTPATAPPAQFCTGAAPNQANASSMVGSPPNQAPNFGICSTRLPSSNGVTTYRLSGMQWIFNWSAPPATARQTYHLCTYDDTHNAQDFCQDITIAPSCP